MIRIQKNRCGYNGYTCVGVPSISSVLEFRGVVADDTYRVTGGPVYARKDADDGTAAYVKLDFIDNYLNIPDNARRWVMSVDHILDMRAALDILQPPEISCNASGDTRYDLFSAPYHDIIDARAVPDTDDAIAEDTQYVTLYDHLLQCAEVACVVSSSAPTTQETSDGTIINSTAVDTTPPYIVEPGCLEPLLSTEFSPVDIDVDPWNLNGAFYALLQLARWRVVVDARLNELSLLVAHLSGLRNLLSAMNRASICDNFQITLTSGNPLRWAGNTSTRKPTYTVAGGTVLLNGENISVGGLTASGAFYAYLNVSISGQDNGISRFKVSMATKKSGVYSLGIGGVREVVSSPKGANTMKYTLYEIVQERCEASITLQHTTKEGIVKWSGHGISALLDTSECPTE